MDNCVLFGKTVNQPELRYTQEGILIAEVLLAFTPETSQSTEPPPSLVKVVGLGQNSTLVQNLKPGSEIFVEGRLSTCTIERPERFKEKKSQIIASKIIPLQANQNPADNQKPRAVLT